MCRCLCVESVCECRCVGVCVWRLREWGNVGVYVGAVFKA